MSPSRKRVRRRIHVDGHFIHLSFKWFQFIVQVCFLSRIRGSWNCNNVRSNPCFLLNTASQNLINLTNRSSTSVARMWHKQVFHTGYLFQRKHWYWIIPVKYNTNYQYFILFYTNLINLTTQKRKNSNNYCVRKRVYCLIADRLCHRPTNTGKDGVFSSSCRTPQ